jgi:hypothetical protein
MAAMVEVSKEKTRMNETLENGGATSSTAKANPALQVKNLYTQNAPGINAAAPQPENSAPVAKDAAQPSRFEHLSIWVLAATFIAGLGFLYYFNNWNWNPLVFSADQFNMYIKLAPLVLLAGLIERAVEVMITPWRDPGADCRSNRVAEARNLACRPGATDDDQQAVADSVSDLNQYTGKTRQYAYSIALALSVCAVVAGVRTLWPLMAFDKAGIPTFPISAQQLIFVRWFDLLLTALLLTGGAAGLHAPINGFITWVEKKKC